MAFLHHLAAFVLFAALMAEHLLFHKDLSREQILKLTKIDLIYGIAAGVVLVVGILRVLYFEKGLDFYAQSTAFYFKMGLFLFVGLISVYPTIQYINWRKQIQSTGLFLMEASKAGLIQTILRLEMVGLLGILLAAALMAKGV